MATSDEIEREMRRRIAEDQQRAAAAQREQAKKLAEGAEAARGFIELMRKHDVAPEPIYRWEQVRESRGFFMKRVYVVERFDPADEGWVVRYSISEFDEPWLISYLRPDGLLRGCDAKRAGGTGFPVEGLREPPPRTVLGPKWTLCLRQPEKKPVNPWLTVDDYVQAARWYLG